MTAPDQSAAPAATNAPTTGATTGQAPRKPALPLRIINWFWRGRELRQLRREVAPDSAAAQELSLRARLLFELGERATNPAEPLPYRADAAAAELYRESAYFGIRALAAARGHSTAEPWVVLDPALAQQVTGSAERVEETTRLVEQDDFLEAWQLPKEQQALRAQELARLARALLNELSWRKRTRDALWIQRLLRVGLLLVVVAGVVFGVRFLNDQAEQGRDLAVGRPWRTSSSAPGLGCSSPAQQCGENNDYFFHTTEENGPWIELDLGKPTRFSAVRVDNRKDCCFDRAVPMIIEVSNEQGHFRPIARRASAFSSWLATFAPTEARYVRLRVEGRVVMHLSRIRVLR